MWQVLYIAPTQGKGIRLKELLEQNGFLCRLKQAGGRHNSLLGSFEVCVPVSEAEEAYEVLAEHGFQG